MARALLCTLAAVASGCATSGSFVCPSRGGPAWREVTSAHVVLRTNVDEPSARAMVRDLETIRAAMMLAVVARDVPTRGRIDVVAFRSVDELMPFAQRVGMRGFAFGGELGERRIALAKSWDAPTKRLLAHELAHIVTAYAVPIQPRWYAEGLATFLEGMGEGGGRAFGSPPVDSEEFRAMALRPRARDVIEWRQARFLPEDLYAGSYALVHFLYTRHRSGFDELTRRLAAHENPAAAWNAAFPQWSLDAPGATEALDAALRFHVRGAFAKVPAPAAAPQVTLQVRPLSSAEVHTLRLDLPHRWAPEVERAEIAEALAEDPGHVAALAAKARRRDGDPVALARAAVAAHPEDPAAWELLATTQRSDAARAERTDALRRAVALAPERVRSLLLLGAQLGDSGEPTEALAYTQRALELAPSSANALLLHGRVLAELDRCDEAVTYGWRGVDVAAHAGPEAHRWAGSAMGAIEQSCSARRAEREQGAKPVPAATPARAPRPERR